MGQTYSSKTIDEIILEVQYELTNAENLPEAKAKNFQKIYDLLIRKKMILDFLKFNLVFIGEKGIGKTTSILRLFELIQNEKGLLSTAAGGTTVCEVVIQRSQNNKSYFEIIPEDEQLVHQYIEDYCASFQTEELTKALYVPNEIERFLRNMAGYKKVALEEKFGEFTSHEDFLQFFKAELNLENRKELIVDVAYNDEKSYFESSVKIFELINLGKVSTIPFPKKIIIHATPDVIDFDSYSFVNSIIDTRGIDSDGKNTDRFRREDILEYLDKRENESIYVVVDGFKPAPSSDISNLLKSRIRDKHHANKFYLLINVYNEEASEVMTDDGIAETASEGINYRKDNIISKFKHLGIPFSEDHILFYNSKKNEPINAEIISQINNNLLKERDAHILECEQAYEKFQKLKYDFENSEYANEKLLSLKEEIESKPDNSNVLAMVLGTFISDKLRNVHPARLDAVNRYRGHYSAYNYYHYLALATEDAFNSLFEGSKKEVETKLSSILSLRNLSELERFEYELFLDDFINRFSSIRLEITELVKEAVIREFQPIFWEKATEQYGKGEWPEGNYRDAVFKYYREELIRILTKVDTQSLFINGWKGTLDI